MKGSTSEFEVLAVQSSNQQMNPPSLTRPKSSASLATILVDMGGRGDADLLRLKSNGAMDMYSPARKPVSRPESVSRIHCIPLLMVFVFFILWTASSEILPEGSDGLPARFVMKMHTDAKLTTSEELPNDEIFQDGTRTVLINDNSDNNAGFSVKGDESHSLEYYRSRKRASVRNAYMRGTATEELERR